MGNIKRTRGSIPTRQPGQSDSTGADGAVSEPEPLVARTIGDRETRRTPPVPAGQLEEGTLIAGRYRVVRRISGGGMGDVYEVFDQTSEEHRAVKLLRPELSGSQDARQRMRDEARTLRDLRHPNLVKTYDLDFWSDRNALFLVMELVPGGTLRDVLREQAADRGPVLPLAEILEILVGVCRGLSVAHRVTVHRDLKPENIFAARDQDGHWQVRVGDFGIGRLHDGGGHTVAGNWLGTPDYMAPEQRRDASDVDVRADVYSAGVVLYELLTGELPVGSFDLPSVVHGAIPRSVDQIVQRALKTRVSDRFADMAMLQSALQNVLQELGSTPGITTAVAPVVHATDLNLSDVVIRIEQRRVAPVQVEGLPPAPQQIAQLRAEIVDLERALRDLSEEIHPALRELQMQRDSVKSQLAQTEADLSLASAGDEHLVRQLQRLLDKDGNPSSAGLQQLASGSGRSVADLIQVSLRCQNVLLSGQAVEAAEAHYREVLSRETKRLVARLKSARRELETASEDDVAVLLRSQLPSAEVLQETPFPFAYWGPLSRLIEQQGRYHWSDSQLLGKAQEQWSACFSERRETQERQQTIAAARMTRRKWIVGGGAVLCGTLGVNWWLEQTIHYDQPLERREFAAERAVTRKLPEQFAIDHGHDIEINNSIGMKFRLIPPGTFLMGSPGDEERRISDEHQHEVTLTRAFYMGVYPVTQGEWTRVMGSNPSEFKSVSGQDTSRFPVEQVSWNAAQEFLGKLNASHGMSGLRYRLPSEAEWEYACRAGTISPYSFGNVLKGDKANCDGNYPYGTSSTGPYLERPSAVGSYDANGFGLSDMHGNVWEWCEDWYGADYYSSSPSKDPAGPSSGSVRVLRGGSWDSRAHYCRSAVRNNVVPADSFNFLIGFRVLCELS